MRAVAAFAMIWLAVFTVTGAGAGVRDKKPNLVGGELFGRSGFIAANYERFFARDFGLGAGIGMLGEAVMLPMYASYVIGDVHSLYLSTGVTYAYETFDRNMSFTASAGYQFHSPGGFFVRPFLTYVPSLPFWPGVTIGGSF